MTNSFTSDAPKPASFTFSIALGERWWGGAIHDGSLMPFTTRTTYATDLRDKIGGNQAQPLLVSNRGRYIWSDEAFGIDIADGRISLTGSADIRLDKGYFDLRGAFRAAAAAHFPPTGRMPDPLNFTAPQYNTWIEMLYEPTQEKVAAYADQLVAHQMPPGIFMIDDNWMQDYGDWTFHPGRFPNPREMADRLRERGYKLVLWVCPFISPDGMNFRALRKRDCLVKDAAGEIAIRRWWNGFSAVLDLTHPDAREWVHAQLDRLVNDFGVSGFKFDAGDPEGYRTDDKTFAPTSPTGQCEAWAKIGLNYSTSEYRACWKMANQPLIQRLRDKHPTWGRDGLSDLIPNSIAQGLMGYAFCCPDLIGGGDYTQFLQSDFKVDQELFVRTTQCSTLFPIMQFSVAPWRVLDAQHLECVMRMVRLREQLGPEIARLATESAGTGEPILRSLAYNFPEGNYGDVTDQFMLGDDILVAPALEKGITRRPVVFPPGAWQDDQGEMIEGGRTIEVDAPVARLPWYRRAKME